MLLKRKYLFGTTILAGVMAVTAPAFAQDQLPGVNVQGQADAQATEIDEVVVTGSRIRRDPTNAPTPLIQVSRETLLSTGQSTVVDYLATIPALSNSLVPSDTTGSNLNDGGLSFANLRSLGSGRTLTLVDGRRHVGAAQGNLAVDVDSIPRLLIENIEIVTGGASSVYGADAVSGVLNFQLRRDFEGMEIDANYGMINQDGQANKRISALIGTNLLDDRLNLYAFAEYEDIDMVESLDIDWLDAAHILLGVDADPTSAPYDGMLDNDVFSGVRRLDRPRWGQTTLANSQRPSPINDPDVGASPGCTSLVDSNTSNCYAVDPTKTYWYQGNTARLANFGQRVGNVGTSRPFNIGGDGENPNNFSSEVRIPESTSERYQVGANFAVADNVDLSVEYKFITEDTFDISQPTFFDIYLSDGTYLSNWTNPIRNTSTFDLRYSDNAYLPQNVKDAITANTVTNWTANANTDGTAATTTARQWARHAMFGPQRSQDNTREVERYVIALSGDLDQVGFIKNIDWDLSWVSGEARNENVERGVDVQRFALAADAVVDTAGIVNGRPGEIVCRARRIRAGQTATVPVAGDLDDYVRGVFGGSAAYTGNASFRAAVDNCVPLNVFGAGNQSQAALDYVDAAITVSHTNKQEQALGVVSGQLWDFWGAGEIGMAIGAEYRKEFTEGVGRTRTTGDRLLFLNTGADFAAAEYESKEWFAELSIPLFRDGWMGEYAELSGSYRAFDYTTAGEGNVYGVNLVYRPIRDITFKTSFNTSFRAPNLAENFGPSTQTFSAITDPCATASIAAQNPEVRANRIANCTALATAAGFTFDFAGVTATTADDFRPVYTSTVAGINRGNLDLTPEESESFTFSTVIQPRWFPNLSIILDYYEIELSRVIVSPNASALAASCVSGASLNPDACNSVFRLNPLIPFGVGNVNGHPVGGFIQQPVNLAALTTRGLDFSARYSLDTEEAFGVNLGRFNYSVGGLWLIEQENFTNVADPTDGTELGSGIFYPRVRLTSSLTWSPNDIWSVNWSMDWQTAQNSTFYRDNLGNLDTRPVDTYNTGNFARHDFTVRWNARDDLSVRMGVVNAFDAEQPRYLGGSLLSNMDPYGTRFFVGLNYRPF
jgi:outer membrane receptor protein involved in Fe transport